MSGPARRFIVSPNDEELLGVFLEELPNASRLWATTGYLTPAVFALLKVPLERMAANVSLRLLVGELMPSYTAPFAHSLRQRMAEDPGVVRRIGEAALVREWRESTKKMAIGPNEAAGLERLAALVGKGALELRGWDPAAARMHGKTYLITRADGSRLAIVGSANLTPSGLRVNIEMVSLLDDRRDEDRTVIDQIEASFVSLWGSKHAVEVDQGRIAQEIRRTAKSPAYTVADLVECAEDDPVSAAQILVAGGGFFERGEELKPHQLQFIAHAYRQHSRGGARLLLADEVGLGKTLEIVVFTALASIASERPSLLVVPPSLMRQIQDEASGIRVPIAFWDRDHWRLGEQEWPRAGEAKGLGVDACPTLIGMVSAGMITSGNRELESALLRGRYAVVVFDEAHRASGRAELSVARQPGARRSFRQKPNNLYRFAERISSRCDSIILSTATPMQLKKLDVFDLLLLLRRGSGDDRVLGSESSLWRADPEYGLSLVGRPAAFDGEELDDDRAISAVLDPLIDYRRESPREAEDLDGVYRHQLQILGLPSAGGAYPPYESLRNLPVAPHSASRKIGAEKARRLIGQLTPYHRLIVRRTRAQLEALGVAMGGLPKIGVQLYGESEHEGLEGDPMLLSAAEIATKIIASRSDRGALSSTGFMKTTLLRRIFSSPEAGKISLQRLLQNQIAEEERIGLVEEKLEDDLGAQKPRGNAAEISPDRILNDEERAMAQEALDYLQRAVDEKFRRAAEIIFDGPVREGGERDVAWLSYGCLVFSQFYDTANSIAMRLSSELSDRAPLLDGNAGSVALYTSTERSGIFRDGQFELRDRDELKDLMSKGEFPIVVGTDAASEGLNLQRLGAIIHYDLPWNPTRLDQRQGRVKRIGQSRSSVDVANLRYQGTIEDTVYLRLRSRLDGARELLGQSFANLLTPLWEAALAGDEEGATRTIEELDRLLAEARRTPFDLGGVIRSEQADPVFGTLLENERMAILGRGWTGEGGLVVVTNAPTGEPVDPARKRRIAPHSTGIADLLRAGMITAGEPVYALWKTLSASGTITDDGRLQVLGQVYRTPSAAAESVRREAKKNSTDQESTAANGWSFWAVERSGARVSLADLRSAFETEAIKKTEIEPSRSHLPRTWVVRAGERRRHEQLFLKEGIVGIDSLDGDARALDPDIDVVRSALAELSPDMTIASMNLRASQLHRFVHEMSAGDLIVTWRSDGGGIAIGEVLGAAETSDGGSPGLRRPVRWIEKKLDPKRLGNDLYNSLRSPAAVSSPREQVGATTRLRAVLAGGEDPGAPSGVGSTD